MRSCISHLGKLNMEKGDCSLLCFCSNRHELTRAQFSSTISDLYKLKKPEDEFQRTFMSKMFFFRDTYFLSENVRVRFALYVFAPREELETELRRLEKEKTDFIKKHANKIHTLSTFAVKKPSLSFSIRMETSGDTVFGEPILSNLPIFIKQALSVIKRVLTGIQFVQECVHFSFDKDKTTLAGGLNLPMGLALSKELTENTGEASVKGLELYFTDSNIGLREISFRLQKDKLMVRVIAFPSLKISNKMISEVYDHSRKIANLFLKPRGEQNGI